MRIMKIPIKKVKRSKKAILPLEPMSLSRTKIAVDNNLSGLEKHQLNTLQI